MTSLNPGQMEPFQNRPSLICCWNHEGRFLDLTGARVPLVSMEMDGLLTSQVPVCIPRACRLTKVCMAYAYSDSDGFDFDMVIERSVDCGSNWTAFDPIKILAGTGGFVMNCTCVDVSYIAFDRCDLWRAYLDFTPTGGISFPLMRPVFNFELR